MMTGTSSLRRPVRCKAVGWVRDSKGDVVRYSLNDVCNCLTTFCGGSGFKDKTTGMCNTTPYVVIYDESE